LSNSLLTSFSLTHFCTAVTGQTSAFFRSGVLECLNHQKTDVCFPFFPLALFRAPIFFFSLTAMKEAILSLACRVTVGGQVLACSPFFFPSSPPRSAIRLASVALSFVPILYSSGEWANGDGQPLIDFFNSPLPPLRPRRVLCRPCPCEMALAHCISYVVCEQFQRHCHVLLL